MTASMAESIGAKFDKISRMAALIYIIILLITNKCVQTIPQCTIIIVTVGMIFHTSCRANYNAMQEES